MRNGEKVLKIDLTGQIAVVTGGSSGIGAAIALALAEANATVWIVGRTQEKLEAVKAQHPNIHILVIDVTDHDAVMETFRALGKIDILVTSAGAMKSDPLHETRVEDVDQMMDVNYFGVFNCLRAAVPGMKERGFGTVIVIASVAGTVAVPHFGGYVASKHAAVGHALSIGYEVVRKGVRVNVLCPRMTDTPMLDAGITVQAAKTGKSEDEARANLLRQMPIGTFVTPEAVGDFTLFLCSESGRHISGQALVMGG